MSDLLVGPHLESPTASGTNAAIDTAPPPSPAPTDAIVEEWFVLTFHNRQLDQNLYNVFYAAKLELMARLRALKP